MEYYLDKFDGMHKVPFDYFNIHEAVYYKIKFDKIINECVNHELKKEYGLMGYSKAEYCVLKNDSIPIGM